MTEAPLNFRAASNSPERSGHCFDFCFAKTLW